MFYPRLFLLVLTTGFITFSKPLRAQSPSKDALAGNDSSQLKIYRATSTKINDLVNTRLDVRFDYARHYLYGKAWVSLKPHIYPTDSLRLDAKGMDIKEVALIESIESGQRVKLRYTYDSLQLNIHLPRLFKNTESYTVYIAYTAKPDQLKSGGSAAISSDKGLYFINSDGKDPEKPIQIWTQGESESSSCWFPTIDKPNQKTTEEIAMTVPSKYVTLSNGRLTSQVAHSDGTRTDTWKMDLPHSPYLFMMAVGDFKIYKDKWRDREVSYYLEPKFAPYAKQIFGNTPEMIEFFSKTLGVDYPWNKYAQIVVRDYVSGAMENTTATLHGESVQRTARELMDDSQEDYISHELFHQWFGDYVTCESWSNITVNESFAAFSEILWDEYKYGKDKADADRMEKLRDYLKSFGNGKSPELVRFHYKSREDVFDLVSYNKGAVILYMLRNYVGKEAFYRGLNIYLTRNALKATEAQQLRLALEEASGRDLSQFFNQWYYAGGHPVVSWSQEYSADSHALTLTFNQVQDKSVQTFQFPLDIDLYAAGTRTRKRVLISSRQQTFTFTSRELPELINPDPEHVLVGEFVPQGSTLNRYAYLYSHGRNYIDRFQALDTCLKAQDQAVAFQVLMEGLKDKNAKLRTFVCEQLKTEKPLPSQALALVQTIARSDSSSLARAAALDLLGRTGDRSYEGLFKEGLRAQSLAVEGASLKALSTVDPDAALAEAPRLSGDTPKILEAVGTIYVKGGLDEHARFYEHALTESPEKFNSVLRSYLQFLVESRNTTVVTKGVGLIRSKIEGLHNSGYSQAISQAFLGMAQAKTTIAARETDSAVKQDLTKQAQILQENSRQMSKD